MWSAWSGGCSAPGSRETSHRAAQRRTPWARHAVNCDINEVRRLYLVERLSLTAVAVRLGCSERTIRRLLEAAGVARREDGSEPKHPRADFSADITEKAYLI